MAENRGQKDAQSITKRRAASAYAGFKRLIYLLGEAFRNFHLCLFTDGAKPDCPAGTTADSITESSPSIARGGIGNSGRVVQGEPQWGSFSTL